jgi:beta-galactosidase
MSEFTYKGKSFYLDGEPFAVHAGAIHYWRVVPEYWEDRLKKLRACGFNTVETYTCWNLHERREGEFDFSGNLDVVRFIEIAESLGLKVIIRPGPYICAEFDFGGLPSWLLAQDNMSIRCNDPKYLSKVRPYYHQLFSRIVPHLCTNGGGVIMVQIENEYGSYGDDKEYLGKVVDIYREEGVDCLLFTGDGINPSMLSGGTLPDFLCAANFGSNPRDRFAKLSAFRQDQPLMSAEYWSGWFEHWGEEHRGYKTEDNVQCIRDMLDLGASFSMYMFHGGTNFGFTNGANYSADTYQPTITSYDYCAPLSEAGDMTPTFYALRDLLAKYNGGYSELDVKDTEKKAYGKVTLTEGARLFDNLDAIGKTVHSAAPLSMEQVGQDFGYILYSSTIHGEVEEKPLEIEHVRDRAWVYVNGKLAGIRQRTGQKDEINIAIGKGESVRLDILVENCGRVNYGPKLFDKKGIFDHIRLGNRFHFGWDMTSLTMEDLSGLSYTSDVTFGGQPLFLRGELTIEGTPADTFLRTEGFKKGIVLVNGFNLGRYWNDLGPTKTLYVPAPILREGKNEIIVFETEGFETPIVEFFAEPDLG